MEFIRAKQLSSIKEKEGPVIYWMTREHRVADNWSLLFAQNQALARKQPLVVCCLVPSLPQRQLSFLLLGLQELEKALKQKGIRCMVFLKKTALYASIKKIDPSLIVTDFFPMKPYQKLVREVIKLKVASVVEVDAHNVVPCFIASSKQEWGAYTLRPKIKKLLKEFLTPIPSIKKHPYTYKGSHHHEYTKYITTTEFLCTPGEKAARSACARFLKRLKDYDKLRNDPSVDGQSGLSPYLHFGQISAQKVALLASQSKGKGKEAFLEELIVRKELSDNYCYYNSHYDSVKGFPKWALQTLTKHQKDRREKTYSFKQLEEAQTEDLLWNAAQLQLVYQGKIHGYMRMYWAKQLLLWTKDFQTAFKYALNLNDAYSLDGNDPNGFVGVAWSIGGVHDRPWPERKIFGKVRSMTYQGARNKFDVDLYIEQINRLSKN